ncbi:hypothetical protein ACSBR2_042092 [Camellia fascicularis]
MTGGPYCRPKHWKHNTVIAMAGIFRICISIAMKSAKLEEYGKVASMRLNFLASQHRRYLMHLITIMMDL